MLCFPPRSQRSADSWSPGSKDDAEAKDAPVNALRRLERGPRRAPSTAGSSTRSSDGDRGEKLEHLGVLRELKCPGVLVEPAFISSDAEGARLATPAFRDAIAAALFAGIQDYARRGQGAAPGAGEGRRTAGARAAARSRRAPTGP